MGKKNILNLTKELQQQPKMQITFLRVKQFKNCLYSQEERDSIQQHTTTSR